MRFDDHIPELTPAQWTAGMAAHADIMHRKLDAAGLIRVKRGRTGKPVVSDRGERFASSLARSVAFGLSGKAIWWSVRTGKPVAGRRWRWAREAASVRKAS